MPLSLLMSGLQFSSNNHVTTAAKQKGNKHLKGELRLQS